MADVRRPRITVLAGANGCGKSSLFGEALRGDGQEYFNPDEVARKARELDPSLSEDEANSAAWQKGFELLKRAIEEGSDYTFETTLGGNSIPKALAEAAKAGHRVQIIFVGLDSPERHIARVRARVAKGGHDIPEEKIRARYDASRENLVSLMPVLDELVVWDNSAEGDPATGLRPQPVRVLKMVQGRITELLPKEAIPDWAKPIVVQAFNVHTAKGRDQA